MSRRYIVDVKFDDAGLDAAVKGQKELGKETLKEFILQASIFYPSVKSEAETLKKEVGRLIEVNRKLESDVVAFKNLLEAKERQIPKTFFQRLRALFQ